ncbi:polysaccharide deacetylase family protein [Marininema halotolerans]|nr:polysaccharide deacetylase family protein [Marininema halotolerans]
MNRKLWGFSLFLVIFIGVIWMWNGSTDAQEEKSAFSPKSSEQKQAPSQPIEKKRGQASSKPVEQPEEKPKKTPPEKKETQEPAKDKQQPSDKADSPDDPDQVDHSNDRSASTPRVVYQGPSTSKQVAITFDDGPDGKYTPQILDILQQKQVAATFFVIGQEVRKHPAVAKRIVNENHIIANHTWDHSYLPKLSESRIIGELNRNYREVYKTTGKKMSLMRPPYGATKGIEKNLYQQGYQIINWDIDSRDWTMPSPVTIQQKVFAHVKSGSIILLHSGGGDRSRTVRALPGLIDKLRNQGYQFTTVDRLIGVSPYRE